MNCLRTSLYNKEISRDSIFCPLDIHGLVFSGQRGVVILNGDRILCQRDQLIFGEAILLLVFQRNGNIFRGLFQGVGVDHLERFFTQMTA